MYCLCQSQDMTATSQSINCLKSTLPIVHLAITLGRTYMPTYHSGFVFSIINSSSYTTINNLNITFIA